MRKMQILIVSAFLVSLILSGYQCSSTELTSARLYIQQKNLERAEEVLKKEVTKNPNSEEGWYLLGYINREKKNWKEMLECYQKALAIDKKHEKEINAEIKAAWAENFNAGVIYFNQANKIRETNKDSSEIFMNLAIKSFNNSILLQPDSADNYKNLSYCYLTKDDVNGAISPLQEWIRKSHQLEPYQILGGIIYGKAEQSWRKYTESKSPQDSIEAMKKYQESIDLLSEGVKYHPTNLELNSLMFNSYVMMGRKDQALKKAEEAVQKNPNDKSANYNYGTLLLEIKDYANAVKHFEKALEVDPDYENAIYNLAAAYINWGVKVREEEEEAQAKERTHKKYFEWALPYLEKLTQINPSEPKNWERLGQVYGNLGMA
ncbi:MAG: tetratricopeptide repeat protein, partial [Ignavibacteria bacterium]|nr:tetratricopeptide repeat protein [Ignavibacteria bacterium]